MTIPAECTTNFDAMLRAAANGHLALLECKDARTGELVYIVAMVRRRGDESEFVPVARMLKGNPYDHAIPPSPDKVEVIDDSDQPAGIDDQPPTGSMH